MTTDQQPTRRCRGCGKPYRLRDDGRVSEHTISWKVSAKAVPTVGVRTARRPCPGAGHPPKGAPDG